MTPLLLLGLLFAPANAGSFDWPALKRGWRQRIEDVRKTGQLPLFDIESTYDDLALDPKAFARDMDANGVALIAFSPEMDESDLPDVVGASSRSVQALVKARPRHFVPMPTGHLYRAFQWGLDPFAFLDALFSLARRDGYPSLGEFASVEYVNNWLLASSPPGSNPDTIGFPLEGEFGRRLFEFSQMSGIPFQLHLEVEDELLAGLERMLARYPGAQVVWCHVGRVRYPERAARYGPEYLRGLLEKHPQLYFTLAGSEFYQYYPPTDSFCSTLWDRQTRHLKPQWRKLITDYPWHFMVAFNSNSDRAPTLRPSAYLQRAILQELPPEVREIVAYKAAWKLLFRETL